jgi:hypothetical protein
MMHAMTPEENETYMQSRNPEFALFCEAAMKGDLNKLAQYALTRGDYYKPAYVEALSWAISEHQHQTITYLLSLDPTIIKDRHILRNAAGDPSLLPTLRMLLSLGPSKEAINLGLFSAGVSNNVEAMHLLLQIGATFETESTKETILLSAVCRDRIDQINLMIQLGAKVTPGVVAAARDIGNKEIIQLVEQLVTN